MDTEKNNSQEPDSLRLYIREIESWLPHRPPSLAELERVAGTHPLSPAQKHKLQELIQNHIYRYRQAFHKGSYNQALIELSRACVLDPTNTRNRVELARVFLKNSPERRSTPDNHSKRALRLVEAILETWPDDPHALEFIKEYQRNLQNNSRNLHPWYRLSIVFLLFIFLGLAWRERDWLLERLPISRLPFKQEPSAAPSSSIPIPVSFNTINMKEKGLNMEITLSRLEHRNEDPFLEIQGRLQTREGTLGSLTLMVRARNIDKKAVLSIPWEVRRESDPLLLPGDSQPLGLFRWLTNPIEKIETIEISPHSLEIPEPQEEQPPQEITVVWELPRPDGTRLRAEIRNPKILDGYDRSVLQTELALSNLGIHALSTLSLEFSLPFLAARTKLEAIKASSPPMLSGERRVWPIRLSLPPENESDSSPGTLHITSISLDNDSYPRNFPEKS